jgi:hypothetical protein
MPRSVPLSRSAIALLLSGRGVSSRPLTKGETDGQARRQDHHHHRCDQRHRPAYGGGLRRRRRQGGSDGTARGAWAPAASEPRRGQVHLREGGRQQRGRREAGVRDVPIEVGPARLPVQQCRRPGAGRRHRNHCGRGLRCGDGDPGAFGDARHETRCADPDEAGSASSTTAASPAAVLGTRHR